MESASIRAHESAVGNGGQQPVSAAQVREKTFTSTRFKPGYDEDEVDAFLDEVEHALTVLHQEIAGLRDQLTVSGTAELPAASPAAAAVALTGPLDLDHVGA